MKKSILLVSMVSLLALNANQADADHALLTQRVNTGVHAAALVGGLGAVHASSYLYRVNEAFNPVNVLKNFAKRTGSGIARVGMVAGFCALEVFSNGATGKIIKETITPIAHSFANLINGELNRLAELQQ